MIAIFKDLHMEELDTIKTKGEEYSGSKDVFRNFKDTSTGLELTKEKILWIFLRKHLDAILHYIKTGKTVSSETIWGRILDARVYLGILTCMAIDSHKEEEPPDG